MPCTFYLGRRSGTGQKWVNGRLGQGLPPPGGFPRPSRPLTAPAADCLRSARKVQRTIKTTKYPLFILLKTHPNSRFVYHHNDKATKEKLNFTGFCVCRTVSQTCFSRGTVVLSAQVVPAATSWNWPARNFMIRAHSHSPFMETPWIGFPPWHAGPPGRRRDPGRRHPGT